MSQLPKHPLDLEHLHQISEGDVEFEIEVLRVYIEDVLERLTLIREACVSGDRPVLMAESHHIKGSSSNVGALPIREVAAEIERLAKSDDLVQVSTAIIDLIERILILIKEVEQFITDSELNEITLD